MLLTTQWTNIEKDAHQGRGHQNPASQKHQLQLSQQRFLASPSSTERFFVGGNFPGDFQSGPVPNDNGGGGMQEYGVVGKSFSVNFVLEGQLSS